MAQVTAAKKQDKQLYSQRIMVLVRRDMTAATPRVIWSHEKPILEAIFGEDTIEEVNPKTLDEGYNPKVSPEMLVHKPKNGAKQDAIIRPSESHGLGFLFIGDPAMEYQRLAEHYGRLPDENITAVERVYGRFQGGSFGSLLASPSLQDLPESQLRSLIHSYGVDIPEGANLIKLAEETGIETA